MELEYPPTPTTRELIHQLQISFRKEAGVPSSFDPQDSTLKDLPSLQKTIEGLDPSPPYLRCKQCRGKLLRGIQSIVCVYCGAHHHTDIPPHPISFKSTFAYRWLLNSLDLDGSEVVEACENKGKNASTVLSDLFNIELAWPADSDKNVVDIANTPPKVIKNPLNLAGVDLDNFFSETKKESNPSGPEQHLLSNKPVKVIETHTSPGQGSLSFFENIKSSEALVRPPEGADNDPSGWEAEFQSAEVRTLPLGTESGDFFLDAPPVALSSPLEAVVGSEAEIKFEFDGINQNPKEKNVLLSHTSMGNNLLQDDQWHTSNIDSSIKIGSEAIKDGEPIDNSNDISSTKDNLFQDDIWLTRTNKHREDEESLDAWQDFTSSGNASDLFLNSPDLTSTTKASTGELVPEKNLASSSNTPYEMEFDGYMMPDLFPGISSLHNGSTSVNNVQEGFYSGRLEELNTGESKSIENGNNVSFDAAANKTVETLMSQMHDLSFMLDSNLCIPEEDVVSK